MPRRIAPHLPSARAFVPSQLEGDRLSHGTQSIENVAFYFLAQRGALG